ncbi:TPA: hypothetical protein QH074_004309 [Enterobacter hormaechei subsp. steigerwaltii]|nr:hypothetical protein [Enterobacter hormaechei subsp. steigerwaltii]
MERKFKLVVRVDLIPDGLPTPPIIQHGMPPYVNFELAAEAQPDGVAYTGIDIALGEHPEPINRMMAYALTLLPEAFNSVLNNDHSMIMHAERRDYDRNGNFTVRKQKFDA